MYAKLVKDSDDIQSDEIFAFNNLFNNFFY